MFREYVVVGVQKLKAIYGQLDSRQRLRLTRIGFAAATYMFAGLCTLAFIASGAGSFTSDIWAVFVGYSLLVNVTFPLLVLTGVNRKFTDPSMTTPQIIAALIWAMIASYGIPEAKTSWLLLFIPSFMFGSFRLDRPRYLKLAGIVSIILLVTDLLIHFNGSPISNVGLWLTEWLIMSLILVWSALFGSYVYQTHKVLRQKNKLLLESENALQHSSEVIRKAAETDFLTQLPNRRAFSCWLDQEHTKSAATPHALLLMDVDHFKQINDTFGHHTGDLALVEIAKRIRLLLREQDRLIRWGGEEFLLVLSGADQAQAIAVAERIRLTFAQRPLQINGTELNVTLSLGLSCVTNLQEVDAAISAADKLLYQAKQAGRNCVMPIAA